MGHGESAKAQIPERSSRPVWRYVPKQGFRRYSNAMKNLIPIRFKRKSGSIDDAGLFSFILFGWVSKHMYRAYRKGFVPEEWPRLSPYEGGNSSSDRIEFLWKDELERRGAEHASFKRVIWRFVRTRVLIATTFLAISMVCSFVSQTLLMRKLLEHLESPEDGLKEGLKWAGYLILTECLRLVLFSWMWAISYRTAVRLKVACMIILYRKVIRLNHLENTSTGELINIFSTDCQRIVELTTLGPMVIGGPIMTLCGIWYIVSILGPIALCGILVFALFFPIQYAISYLSGLLRCKKLKISDTRIRITSEILDSMKLIKMYGWGKHFSENLLAIRNKEQTFVLGSNYCSSLSSALTPTLPVISAIVTFLAYVSTGRNLTASQAFPITTFFGSHMSQTLMRSKDGYETIIDSSIAFGRLERVLLLEEGSCPITEPSFKVQAVVINHGSFTYNFVDTPKETCLAKDAKNGKKVDKSVEKRTDVTELKTTARTETAAVLFDIVFEASIGKLIGICGPVGSGKSSLLLAALGQLRALQGRVMRRGSCAYASQQAWIINATLRENILFGEPFDAERYYKALRVCNLSYDLEIMPGGDQTEIGERGINLSGGQKQRVALARAFYANRDIYFLDDPLSAVDAHVGLHIFENLIAGALSGKTVLFVTHQVQYLNRCDDVYMMRDGRIVEHGTHHELMKLNQEYAIMVNAILAENADSEDTIAVEKRIEIYEQTNEMLSNKTSNETPSVKNDNQNVDDKIDLAKPKVALAKAETREEGEVRAKTYLSYARAAGGFWAALLVSSLTLMNVGSMNFSSWWLAKWLNAGGGNVTDTNGNVTIVSDNINDNPNFSYYQSVYGSSIGMILGANLLRSFVFCKSTIKASTNFHNRLFRKILNSPMRFFDTTPTGRIQNLFSSDLDEVDSRLPKVIDVIMQNILSLSFAFISICLVFPWLVLLMCIISVPYYFFSSVYRVSLRGLKRVESTTRSPIFSLVSATVQGLDTIHAFGKAMDFKAKFNQLVDDNSGFMFMGLVAKRWFAVRTDGLAIVITSIIVLFVVITKGQVPAALAGLALTYTAYISGIFQYTIRVISDAETQFIAVERMNQYIRLPDVEESPTKTCTKVEDNWPTRGIIEFQKVSMSYAKDTPLVLNNISFVIEPREKIGIIGRTGAGKSSLTLALFRLVELSGGKIIIDNVDISEISLDQLRSRLSVIPQDPVLFSGTIRSNLDPFKLNSDAEIWEALEKTKLKDRVRAIEGQLDAIVGFSGDNLSVGERQLLCLARALLRRTKILVLDEATAAVDPETEIAVQNTIQQSFSDATVLTIAHRLQTVVSCDRIIVMDNGRVIEFDSPSSLLSDENSQFSKMMAAAETIKKR